MNCREVIDALSDYVDDNLDSDQGDSIDIHLESCAVCQGVLNTFQRTVGFCRDTTVAPLTPEELASLKGEVRKAWEKDGRPPGGSGS